jgi:ATP-dependent helicase/nuclease subunit A
MTITPPAPPPAASPSGSGTPIDQEARDRLLHDLDRTFFVEAGAGTGKTTTLVGRIENLIATGRVTLDRLAAITFTEAAASELRDRVRERLERGSVEREDAEERARCRQAAGEIDLAAISTIHAFAGGLLRAFPLEAGLPPSLRMLDKIEQGMRFEERFREWFRGPACTPPAAEILRRANEADVARPQQLGERPTPLVEGS